MAWLLGGEIKRGALGLSLLQMGKSNSLLRRNGGGLARSFLKALVWNRDWINWEKIYDFHRTRTFSICKFLMHIQPTKPHCRDINLLMYQYQRYAIFHQTNWTCTTIQPRVTPIIYMILCRNILSENIRAIIRINHQAAYIVAGGSNLNFFVN